MWLPVFFRGVGGNGDKRTTVEERRSKGTQRDKVESQLVYIDHLHGELVHRLQ